MLLTVDNQQSLDQNLPNTDTKMPLKKNDHPSPMTFKSEDMVMHITQSPEKPNYNIDPKEL